MAKLTPTEETAAFIHSRQPVIRSAIALLVFLCKGSRALDVDDAYNIADQFLEQLSIDSREE